MADATKEPKKAMPAVVPVQVAEDTKKAMPAVVPVQVSDDTKKAMPAVVKQPVATKEVEGAKEYDEPVASKVRKQLLKTWNEDEIINSILSGDMFIDNPYNDYNNIAYNWRFYAMADLEYLTGDVETISDFFENIDGYKQVTIAETGVTGFNITSVSISSVFGSAESRSSQTGTISMNIMEPGGVSFLDALMESAAAAGVTNYKDFPYFLELTFKGYRKDGTIDTRPFKDMDNGGRWLWAVTINNIDANLSTGGGLYKLDMLSLQQEALKTEYHNLLDDCQVIGSTVGEVFEIIGENMTKQWARRFGTEESLVSHKFVLHGLPTTDGKSDITPEDISKMSVIPSKKSFSPQFTAMDIANTPQLIELARKVAKRIQEEGDVAEEVQGPVQGEDGVERQTFVFSKGQDVSGILDIVFSACEDAQNLAKDSSSNPYSSDDAVDKVNDKGVRETLTWQVIPEVRYRNGEFFYDQISNRYAKDIKWHIYPRINHNVVLSQQQIIDATKPENQKSILSAIAARGFLAKRYDYIFTGLNTEVLSFDLAFNLAWNAALPTFQHNFDEQVTEQALVEIDKNKPWQTDPLGYYQGVLDESDAIQSELNAKLSELETAKNEGADEETIAQLESEVSDLTKTLRANTAQVRFGRSNLDEARAANPIDAPSLTKTFERDYIETIQMKQEAGTANRYKFRIPISVTGGDESKAQVGTGSYGQEHAGRSIYGAILNQSYGVATAAFQKITLTIRGDPYWIGEGGYEQDILHNEKIRSNRSGNISNSTTGYNCFLLRFKYPLGYDETGRNKLKDNETVTGIYQVTNVVSKFDGGQLQHELTAIRVQLIDLASALTITEAEAEAIEDDNE